MSQYPSPYSPPQFPDYAVDPASFRNPLAPARRSGIMMFVLGGLGLVCGAIMMLFGALVTPEILASAPNADQIRLAESQIGLPFRGVLIGVGILILLPGLVYITLGFFVRRGGMVSCIFGAILTGITMVLLLLQFASVLIQHVDAASMAGGACIFLLPTFLCILLMTWLIQAIRAAPAVAAMRNQFNAQYWQSYQQQQYAQNAYGYGAPGMQPPPGPAAYPQQMYPAQYNAPAPPPTPQAPPPEVRHPPLPPDNQSPESQNRDSN